MDQLGRLPLRVYSIDKYAFQKKDHVGRGALIEAYQRPHEPTRTTRSLLHCVLALLDALDHEEPLKNFGLHVKMTHDDPKLYLVSHCMACLTR